MRDELPSATGVTEPENLTAIAYEPADGFDNGAVEDVCHHIEMLDALLAAITSSADVPVLPSAYLLASRRFFLQLREGLAGRRLDQLEALQLLDGVKHNLREVDSALRHQHGLSLEDALHTRIGEVMEIGTDLAEQLRLLDEKVMRLFDTSAQPTSLVPVPQP